MSSLNTKSHVAEVVGSFDIHKQSQENICLSKKIEFDYI